MIQELTEKANQTDTIKAYYEKLSSKKLNKSTKKKAIQKKSTSQISMYEEQFNKIKIGSFLDLKTCKEHKQLLIFYWVILLQTIYLKTFKIRM